MALPGSGAISMNAVNVELGLTATAQISLNDAAVRTLFVKPSGAISLNDGHGKSNVTAAITNKTATAQSVAPSGVTATYTLANTGVASYSFWNGSSNTTPAISGEWLTVGTGADFECFCTLNSGTLNSGTTGTWMALSTTRAWTCLFTSGSAGSNSASITVQLRRVSDSVVVSSATISLTATLT